MMLLRLSALNIIITLAGWMIGMLLVRSLGIHLKIDNMFATLGICWVFLNWIELKHPLE
jgi:hypothetical protein